MSSHLVPSDLQELVHILRHAILIVTHVSWIVAVAEASVDGLIHINDVADLPSTTPTPHGPCLCTARSAAHKRGKCLAQRGWQVGVIRVSRLQQEYS